MKILSVQRWQRGLVEVGGIPWEKCHGGPLGVGELPGRTLGLLQGPTGCWRLRGEGGAIGQLGLGKGKGRDV